MRISKLIGQTPEYQEGWQAYSDGIDRKGNPYAVIDAYKALYWRSGWIAHDDLARDNESAIEDSMRDDPTQH